MKRLITLLLCLPLLATVLNAQTSFGCVDVERCISEYNKAKEQRGQLKNQIDEKLRGLAEERRKIEALKGGARALLDRTSGSSPVGVLAPPESRARVEALLPRLKGDLSVSTLSELRAGTIRTQTGGELAGRTLVDGILHRVLAAITRERPAQQREDVRTDLIAALRAAGRPESLLESFEALATPWSPPARTGFEPLPASA